MPHLPFWYPPILAYHRVTPDRDTGTPTLDPDSFARQMELLSKSFQPISLETLVDSLDGKARLPACPAVVTFDDGTEDLFTHAFPTLQKYRIPATIFVIVGNIGRPGWLTLPQMRDMLSGGFVTFGSHTLSHDYLPELPPARARESLSLSKQMLEEQGIPARLLSYPAGGYTPEIARTAAEVGYRACCTTNRGQRRFPIDRWALRRITMHRSANSFWPMLLRCSGWYGLNRGLRSPA